MARTLKFQKGIDNTAKIQEYQKQIAELSKDRVANKSKIQAVLDEMNKLQTSTSSSIAPFKKAQMDAKSSNTTQSTPPVKTEVKVETQPTAKTNETAKVIIPATETAEQKDIKERMIEADKRTQTSFNTQPSTQSTSSGRTLDYTDKNNRDLSSTAEQMKSGNDKGSALITTGEQNIQGEDKRKGLKVDLAASEQALYDNPTIRNERFSDKNLIRRLSNIQNSDAIEGLDTSGNIYDKRYNTPIRESQAVTGVGKFFRKLLGQNSISKNDVRAAKQFGRTIGRDKVFVDNSEPISQSNPTANTITTQTTPVADIPGTPITNSYTDSEIRSDKGGYEYMQRTAGGKSLILFRKKGEGDDKWVMTNNVDNDQFNDKKFGTGIKGRQDYLQDWWNKQANTTTARSGSGSGRKIPFTSKAETAAQQERAKSAVLSTNFVPIKTEQPVITTNNNFDLKDIRLEKIIGGTRFGQYGKTDQQIKSEKEAERLKLIEDRKRFMLGSNGNTQFIPKTNKIDVSDINKEIENYNLNRKQGGDFKPRQLFKNGGLVEKKVIKASGGYGNTDAFKPKKVTFGNQPLEDKSLIGHQYTLPKTKYGVNTDTKTTFGNDNSITNTRYGNDSGESNEQYTEPEKKSFGQKSGEWLANNGSVLRGAVNLGMDLFMKPKVATYKTYQDIINPAIGLNETQKQNAINEIGKSTNQSIRQNQSTDLQSNIINSNLAQANKSKQLTDLNVLDSDKYQQSYDKFTDKKDMLGNKNINSENYISDSSTKAGNIALSELKNSVNDKGNILHQQAVQNYQNRSENQDKLDEIEGIEAQDKINQKHQTGIDNSLKTLNEKLNVSKKRITDLTTRNKQLDNTLKLNPKDEVAKEEYDKNIAEIALEEGNQKTDGLYYQDWNTANKTLQDELEADKRGRLIKYKSRIGKGFYKEEGGLFKQGGFLSLEEKKDLESYKSNLKENRDFKRDKVKDLRESLKESKQLAKEIYKSSKEDKKEGTKLIMDFYKSIKNK